MYLNLRCSYSLQVQTIKLFINKEQNSEIKKLYSSFATFSEEYSLDNLQQQKALKELQRLGLDCKSRKNLTTRWSVWKSASWSNKNRILFHWSVFQS